MEQITATQYTAPRRSLNRKLASLPPIATGLSESPMMSMNEKFPQSVDLRSPSSSSTSSGGACQNMLPCIMITPSSPTHESDYEIHYFQLPEKRASKCRGFLSSVRQAFCPSSSTSSISLPESPLASQYGYTPDLTSADRSWSASRRFRMILALAAVLFFALHLIAIPKMHNGVYEVFSTDHHGAGSHMMDDAVASWETVSAWQPAPPTDAQPGHSNPVDSRAETNQPASSLD